MHVSPKGRVPSEVRGVGARLLCTGAPNVGGAGGWGCGCPRGVHWCPQPGGVGGWGRGCTSAVHWCPQLAGVGRSEEHTSELQSLMRISYAVFCLKKKINKNRTTNRQGKS